MTTADKYEIKPCADLRGAKLRGADLRRADLRGADLRGADLVDANLADANLADANLAGANLAGAKLRGADLRGASLPTYQKWRVFWRTDGSVQIACTRKTIAEWDEWFASDKVYTTPRGTAEFERIRLAYLHARGMYEVWQRTQTGELKQ